MVFVRRWFAIVNNQLVYRKRSKDSLTIMEEDLRLCTVKPTYDIDRRFCFEVLSPARYVVINSSFVDSCLSIYVPTVIEVGMYV
jgi:Arf-GAP with coiled-coil, ANK repeat and PH domain-containing protein